MEKILSAEEWFEQNKKMTLNKSDAKMINEYANYLLTKQAEYICKNIGLKKTSSEELNLRDYQPFITDENGSIWTINKEDFTHASTEFINQLNERK